jgi:uncharacterized protein (DUF305 family)
MHKTLTAAVLAAALLVLTACGAEDDSDTAAGHNDADVAFAQQMIPHHEQAIDMAKAAEKRAETQEVKDLAAAIEAAQDPEIETMTGWLESWGEDAPDGGMSDMDHGAMSSDDMTGMMADEDMTALENATGVEFDQMFLTMMIEHHEGAIEMARTEQADGEFADAKALAEDIETAQTEEIQTMQGLLKP